MAVRTGDTFQVPITLNDQLSKVAEKIIATAKKLNAGFKKVEVRIIAVNQAMELINKVARGVRVGIEATIGQYAEFEKRLVAVGKTTNLTSADLQMLGVRFKILSQQIPVATNDLLRIAEVAGQLGITGVDNLENFTAVVSKIGFATNLTAEEAASSFKAILDLTGEPISNVEKLASAVVALGNSFNTNEAQLTKIAVEMSKATSVFNLTSKEVVGFSTALAEMKVQAQLGSSVIGRAFREIDAAIGEGGRSFEILQRVTGLAGDELKKQFKDNAGDVFKLFIEGLSRVNKAAGTQGLTATLESLNLKGDEINKVLPAMAKNAFRLSAIMSVSNQEFVKGTALAEESAKAFNTLNATWIKTGNILTNLATDIGGLLAPLAEGLLIGINKITGALRALVAGVSEVDFGKLASEFELLAGVFVAFKFKAVLAGLTSLTVKFSVMAAPLALVALKFTAIALAVGVVIAAADFLLKNLGEGQKVAEVFEASMKLALLGIGKAFFELTKLIFQSFNALVIAIAPALSRIGIDASKMVSAVGSGIAKMEELSIKTQDAMSKTTGDIKEISKGLKAGLGGEIFNQVSKFWDGFNKGLDDANGKLDKVMSKLPQAGDMAFIGPLQENTPDPRFQGGAGISAPGKPLGDDGIKQLKQMEKLSNKIGMANTNAFASQRDIIESNANLQIASANKFLEAQKKAGIELSDEQRKIVDDFIKNVESERDIKLESKGLGADQPFAGGGTEAVGGMLSSGASEMAAAFMPLTGAISAAQAIVDFGPQVIDSITNLLNSVTELPGKIVESISGLLDAILGLVGDLIPNIINAITDILMNIATFLSEGLAQVFAELPDKIMGALMGLLEALPQILEGLITGLINAMVQIFVILPIKLGIALIKFVASFISMIPELLTVIVDALVEGMKEAVNSVFELFGSKGPFNIGKDVEEGVKKLGDSVSRATSKLFAVADLEAAARGLDVADRIQSGIENATKKSGNFLTKVWKEIMKFFTQVWQFVLGLFDAVVAILKAVWDVAVKLFEGVVAILKSVWEVAMQLFEAGINFLRKMWETVFELLKNVFEFAVNLLKDVWNIAVELFEGSIKFLQSIWQGIFDALKAVFEFAVKAFNAWIDFLKNTFQAVFDVAKKVFNFIGEMLSAVWDVAVELFQGSIKFLQSIWQGIFDSLKKVFEVGSKILSGVFDAVKDIFKGVGDVLKKAFDPLMDLFDFDKLKKGFTKLFDTLNPANLFGKMFKFESGGKGTVEKLLGIDIPFVSFARGGEVGGQVPGMASVGGDSLQNDKVLAFLSPGEIVLPRSITTNDKVMQAVMKAIAQGGDIPKFAGGTLGQLQKKGQEGLDALTEQGEGGLRQLGANINSITDGLAAQLDNIKANTFEGILKMVSQTKKREGIGGASPIVPITQATVINYPDTFLGGVNTQGLSGGITGGLAGLNFPGFADGGQISGNGSGDSVPALLTPGEFVVNAKATRNNLDLLSSINKNGQGSVAPSVTTFNIVVNTTSSLTAQSIKTEVVPMLEKELKRKSQQGKFLISQKGTRS